MSAVHFTTLPELEVGAVAGLISDAIYLLDPTEKPRLTDRLVAHIEYHHGTTPPKVYAGLMWDWPPPNVLAGSKPVRGGGTTLPDFNAEALQTLILAAVDELHDTQKPEDLWVAVIDVQVDSLSGDITAQAIAVWDWPLEDPIDIV